MIVNRLEELLRQVNPLLSLHYWDWTQDPTNIPDGNLGGGLTGPLDLFSPNFMGYGGSTSAPIGEPWATAGFYVPGASPDRDSSGGGPADPPQAVNRSVVGSPATAGQVTAILGAASYPLMRVLMEDVHDAMHGYVRMGNQHRRSCPDPVDEGSGTQAGSLSCRVQVRGKALGHPTRHREVTSVQVLSWLISTSSARALLVDRAKKALELAPPGQTGIPAWLNTPQPHGSAIVAQPRSERDLTSRKGPHDALAQLEVGAQGMVAENPLELGVAWPLLVVRGPLYQALPDDFGELKAEPIEWQRVIWGGVTRLPMVVDVVRERHLERYAGEAHHGLSALESSLHASQE